MRHSVSTFEPELAGEIAVRRQHAGEGNPALARRTFPGTDAPQHARHEESLFRVADFERIEDYLRGYLEDERFRATHPLASGRWVVAWEMLWCADSRAKVIAVGHRAGDAMQAFASSLLEYSMHLTMDPQWPDLLGDDSQRPEPLGGLVTVIEAYRQELGTDRCELLRAILEHWGTLLNAMQRHEERPRTVEERLRWEDGRRLVLFTALVMVETDRCFA